MKDESVDENIGKDADVLDDAANALSERRAQSPVRAPATKR